MPENTGANATALPPRFLLSQSVTAGTVSLAAFMATSFPRSAGSSLGRVDGGIGIIVRALGRMVAWSEYGSNFIGISRAQTVCVNARPEKWHDWQRCQRTARGALMGRFVIVAFKPKPGHSDALAALIVRHLQVLRAQNLVTDKAPAAHLH